MQECSRFNVATESLLNAEKRCRLASEVAGCRKSAVDIVEILFKDSTWKTLSDQIIMSSSPRGASSSRYNCSPQLTLLQEGPAQAGGPPSTSLLYAHLNFNSKLSFDGLSTRFDYLMILSYLVVF